jgi:hypothetical protein
MSCKVVAELWDIFEASMMPQAQKLVHDIAKHQGADPKALWALVKRQIKMPLIDIDLPEKPLCIHSVERAGSRVVERCRAPCLAGFERCPMHLSSHVSDMNEYKSVDRVIDVEGIPYFVDEDSIARDSSGCTKGMMEDGVLYLFEK